MEKSVEALHRELMTIRTGRASPALLERSPCRLLRLADPAPEHRRDQRPRGEHARHPAVRPQLLGAIEKAIQKSDLGLNPSNDGQVIRVAIPQLTEERRKDLVKVIHRKAEEARVAVRNIRRDEVDHLRRVEKDGHVSKDEVATKLTDVQKITDQFIARIDDATQRKEAEILEV